MKSKLLIGLLAALAVIIFIIVKADKRKNEWAAFGGKIPTQGQSGGTQKQKQPDLPPVQKTSDPNAVVDGITADYAADAGIAAESDAEVDYLNESSALINSQGVYNENEF